MFEVVDVASRHHSWPWPGLNACNSAKKDSFLAAAEELKTLPAVPAGGGGDSPGARGDGALVCLLKVVRPPKI